MERAVYRIIDANFNRAREALRVVEEFCRFGLNSRLLTERAKQLRHELCGTVGTLAGASLLACRDTVGDVGIGGRVTGQMERDDLASCMTAGCKRLTEALRVLAEVTQTVDTGAAGVFERLRYAAYTLEKDITLAADAGVKFGRVRLYIIITSNLPSEIISLTWKCAAGGADCVQLRAKGAEDDRLAAVAVEFVGICRDQGVLSVINDRVDIAVLAGADGVHLGQNDLAVAEARKLQLAPLIIGKSTHSAEQLSRACGEEPTYVSLGPVFPTATKPGAPAVGLEYVRRATAELSGAGVGHVAVGGITAENVEGVISAGARAVAVCSGVTGQKDVAGACRVLKDRILAARPD